MSNIISLSEFLFFIIAARLLMSANAILPKDDISHHHLQCPEVDISSSLLRESFIEANNVIKKIREKERRWINQGRILNKVRDYAEILHQKFTMTFQRSTEMEKTAECYEEVSKIIMSKLGLSKDQVIFGMKNIDVGDEFGDEISKLCEERTISNCSSSKYRTFDGSCNNLMNSKWGETFICLRRILPPDYEDGIAVPRSSKSGSLPSPRELSAKVHKQIYNEPSNYFTHLVMIWGQFLDHDITLTPISRTVNNEMIQCCPINENDHPQCLPIRIDPYDSFYSHFNRRCLNFVRSAKCSSCLLGPRQQTNQQTAFVDASHIYGTTTDDVNNLRTKNGDGKLLMRFQRYSGYVLPASINPNSDSCSRPNENLLCFRAGDVRVNQNPALTSMHTIWAREHNRIAEKMAFLNPNWSDEKLFQESRRIVIAEMQMITWNEFLPIVLGNEYMELYNLYVSKDGCTHYDPDVDPSLLNEFSTAAFRFGHSLIDGIFDLIHSQNVKSSISLRNNYFYPFELYNGQLDGLMKGATQQPSQCFDEYLIDDVRNHLYKRRGNDSGLDLAAFNIQRGRDHGIPSYTAYLEHILNIKIETFHDLRKYISPDVIDVLRKLYSNVHDIDLYTGGISEIPTEGGIVGPVFASIIGNQFNLLKFGDRFYFEHCSQTGSFTLEQLNEIRKTTLARILCDNSEIKNLQKAALKMPDYSNPIASCSKIPSMNLKVFRH